MTNYTAGEIVLAIVPFSSGVQAKLRPALVVFDCGDNDVIVARMTTQPYRTAWDVEVTDWRNSGMLGPGAIRMHKLASIEKALIRNRIGNLQPPDRQNVSNVLKQLFGNW
jgi:mRNA interferase MazF